MKLTRWQFFCVMTALEVCMTIWLTISPALKAARQDSWISMLVGGLIGVGVGFLMARISLRYPDKTLIQFTEIIFGKWLGKCISLLYFVTWYSVSAVVLRDAADFLQTVLFRQTPIYILIAVVLMLMLYINYRGNLSTMGRFGEIACPLLLVVIAFTFIFNFNNIQPNFILPVFADTGIPSIVKGSVTYASFLGETYFIFMLMPFLVSKKKSTIDLFLIIVTTTITVTLAVTLVIMIYGPYYPANFLYPYFFAVRFISVLEFIENMDIWVILVWVLAVYLKLSLYMFICSYGTAQWLGIKNWKKVIWYFAAIIFVASVLPPNIALVSEDYAQKLWVPYIFPIVMIGIPILMYVVGSMRRKSFANN
ncbi:GerAB/ArcD/ProY family transporter [Paenibacillus gansuensis]|uniref:Endospore germination permease n=1 Tax=Paenibacillus gansuensis TaxID=306542 RepID=A0ABW5P8K7_9BACL